MKKEFTDDDIIICRCEEVTLKDVRDAIKKGYTDFNELKALLRVGMGPCQGRTCGPLILRELARAKGVPPEEISPTSFRPPAKPVEFSIIGGIENEE